MSVHFLGVTKMFEEYRLLNQSGTKELFIPKSSYQHNVVKDYHCFTTLRIIQ